MKMLAALGMSVIVLVSATGCDIGSHDDSLTPSQRTAATKMAHSAKLNATTARCIAGRLDERATRLVRRDPDFSDLAQEPTAGAAVAVAYLRCTGRTFSSVYGYDPARG